MTKKDYIAIAAVIKHARKEWIELNDHSADYQTAVGDAIEGVATDIADMLQRDNDRFDRDRFLEACGVEL